MVINNHQCPAGDELEARLTDVAGLTISCLIFFYVFYSVFLCVLIHGWRVACSVGRCAVVEIPCRMSIYLWSFVLFGFRPVWLGLVGGWSGAHASLHPLSLSLYYG
jgi:hypothetical protein